jgi:copper(I)-binding protein
LDELKVPPKQSVDLKPGGRHLMLIGPTGHLETVTVDFFAGDDMVLTVSASTED